MNLTNEVLEMWEEDARRDSNDYTAANARLLRLLKELREDAELLAFQHARLFITDPEYRRVALASE